MLERTAYPAAAQTVSGSPSPRDAIPDVLSRLAHIPADRPAVVSGRHTVSFGELMERTNLLCEQLRGLGAGPESIVALCLAPSIELVVGILAVLKAGAAYLPLDPRYPADRLTYMVTDSRSTLLVTARTLEGHCAWPSSTRVVYADEPAAAGAAEPASEAVPGNLAYVIYTSGSTGRPKGVEVTREGVWRLLDALERGEVAGVEPGRVGWNASVSFDASVQQWVRLLRGDTLVLIDPETRSDPTAMVRFIEQQRLTDLDITPSHLTLLLEHLKAGQVPGGGRVRLLVGGEAISPSLWTALRSLEDEGRVLAMNLYGPTECVVDSTMGRIGDDDGPHLGGPLPDVRVYILDDAMNPVEDGEPGELYIGGPRLARGYRGRPGLTAERFLPDATAANGSRIYRTGDRARWRASGRLEYLGRLDNQVKVRGFRVELGEIEAALREIPGVDDAVVTQRDDLPSGPGLVAYCRTSGHTTVDNLREALSTRLPDFMLPAAFMIVDDFPLTPNGKIDRAGMPAPEDTGMAEDHGYVPPEGRFETLISEVWSEVLGIDRISATDNFLQVGGHSILAIRVVAALKREARITIPMAAIFKHPRLRDLADYVEGELSSGLRRQEK